MDSCLNKISSLKAGIFHYFPIFVFMRIGISKPLKRVPSNFLSIQLGFILLAVVLLGGVAGFMIIEGYSFGDAVYMTVITVSTVGYTEVRPLSEAGRVFTSVYILFNIVAFAYLLSVFTYYIIQGEIFKKMHENLVKTRIDKLERHVILCGYGKYGKEIAHHFALHKLPFVVIDENPVEIENIQKSSDDILYIKDDATHDEALVAAGIKRAQAIIAALPDDAENVFTVLTARQLNPSINIISRAKNPKSVRKLTLAGANHVVMPEQIGGFYMATLVSKPGAVEFFSFITNEYQSDIGFEEIRYEDLPDACRGQSIRELFFRKHAGANIIGYKGPGGNYMVNPDPEIVLTPGGSFIVLGDNDQLEALRNYLASFDDHQED
jgi:voltage-gated potassium channel